RSGKDQLTRHSIVRAPLYRRIPVHTKARQRRGARDAVTRRRKLGRQVVKVEVDPGEVDALIDRGYLHDRMMAVGGEAMLLDTTSGFEQPDAVRSPLSPLGEGERTPSAIACVQRLPQTRSNWTTRRVAMERYRPLSSPRQESARSIRNGPSN